MTNLLIIDDESLIRIAIRSLEQWEQEGICVIGEASNGIEALDFLQKHPETDIAIVDVDMPILNGLEFAERVQEEHIPIQIIFLSSFDSFAYARRAFIAGAHDYILKTELDEGRLLTLIKSIQQSSEQTETEQPVSLRMRTALHDYFGGSSSEIPFSLSFPVTLVLLRPADESLVSKRYADNPESIMRLTVDLLRQCCIGVQGMYCMDLSISRYVLLLPSTLDSKPLIGEFLRSSTIYLDLLFDYKVSGSLDSWEQVKEAYIKLDGMYAPMSRMVVRARRYIQEHFAEVDLNLSRIAYAVEISKNHLSWEFSKETGQSLSSYISQVRIEHAIPLLEQTNLMTYEIADTVGFKNVETFARMFKKITGKTPRNFS